MVGNTEAARLADTVQVAVQLGSNGSARQEADRGGELSTVRLESDPGGAQ